MKYFAAIVWFLALPLFCSSPADAENKKYIVLATTTSMQDSGLLDVLVPLFEKKTGFFLKTIAVGSGQALALGSRGEADVLLVHAPHEEERFMLSGNGIRRRKVMHNDFIVVGPPEDPAGIRTAGSAVEAFKKIAGQHVLFISRADNSGTHAVERRLWQTAGVQPEGMRWYQETGLGMGQSLGIASEKGGYTLSDRGTFWALKKNLQLAVLVSEDALLKNVYHVIEVNSQKFPKVNAAGAKAFADFITSPEAQQIIKTFGVSQYGEPLFYPAAGQE
ncbi:MAG: substrate-binding domain-containing protein [Desulfobacterota bacterium]|nr:substrate-binding domain-containing protein [Thermodesulfobacteriota bacterium]